MPHNFDNHHLYVIPYYIFGICSKDGKELKTESYDRVNQKIDERISIRIEESSHENWVTENQRALTLWIEFKTPLMK